MMKTIAHREDVVADLPHAQTERGGRQRVLCALIRTRDAARAASGQVAAAPPRSLMNLRRFMAITEGIVPAQSYTGKGPTNVRFGSKADIGKRLDNVRFTPKSGHCSAQLPCPLCATNGLMHRSKWHSYSITSSARCRRNKGTSRPSALAVFRLITSSNLSGAWTGSSLGFAPLRMRST